MNSNFFRIINDFNLCTYYLLPLLRLNKLSFGAPQNFVDCYVSSYGDILVVKLRMMAPFLTRNKDYMTNYLDSEGFTLVLLSIPEEFSQDVSHFMRGKFTQMSQDAKDLIRSYSALAYKQENPKTKKTQTDARLMALEDDPEQRAILRVKLEEELDCIFPESWELISKPSESNYIELTARDEPLASV